MKLEKMDKTIEDLPAEIIQDYLFQYLDDTDIYNISQSGSLRLKEVSENFIQLGEYLNHSYLNSNCFFMRI